MCQRIIVTYNFEGIQEENNGKQEVHHRHEEQRDVEDMQLKQDSIIIDCYKGCQLSLEYTFIG